MSFDLDFFTTFSKLTDQTIDKSDWKWLETYCMSSFCTATQLNKTWLVQREAFTYTFTACSTYVVINDETWAALEGR